jgi:hypothetical protein
MIKMPLDIWDVIIASASHNDQRVVLHVNRTLHAVACCRLFNILHLYLGAWDTLHVTLSDKVYERNLLRLLPLGTAFYSGPLGATGYGTASYWRRYSLTSTSSTRARDYRNAYHTRTDQLDKRKH